MPTTRIDFWREKFHRNVERDRMKERALVDAGWQVLTVWECETREAQTLSNRLRAAFGLDAMERASERP